jgi:Zn finger protein HypA/HybF involved in hydrogenase expression
VCVSAVVGIRRAIERLPYAHGRRDEWISIEAGSRHCAGCAYDLRGLPLGVRCPECGSRTMS